MSFSSRASTLVSSVIDSGAEAGVVTSLHDLRWLTGFTGSNGCAVVTRKGVTFITDFRYTEQAEFEVPDEFETVIADGPLRREVSRVIGGGCSVAFDPAQITALDRDELEEALQSGSNLVPVKNLLTALRAVKDPGEIEKIQAAAEMADAAFVSVLEQGVIGRTEKDIAWALEVVARRLGAEGMSFAPIVAAGPHGALPHASPRDVPIAQNQLVVVDWGVVLDGYCSDCTRTVATGEIGEEATAVYDLVNKSREAGLAAVEPGPTGSEVDAVARAVIEAGGYGEYFGHGLGHGVGLEIHEAPGLGKTGQMGLAAGMVVTVEPGIYLPGKLGVRIEDLVEVTVDGPRLMTGLSRELQTVS